jgi:ubiquinone/menaquinone biosynthesis C-methylase UbiE
MEKIQDSGKVKKLTGVDNAKSAVERGKKKKLDIRLIKSVDQKLPFPKNSFDCIVAGELIEHLFDVNKFINEIHRVLKPKGELIITTPNLASLGARITLLFGNTPWMIENEIGGKNAGHMRYFTFRTLDKILKKYKFEPIFKTTEAIHLGSKLIISNTFITDKMYYLGREIIVKYKKAR